MGSGLDAPVASHTLRRNHRDERGTCLFGRSRRVEKVCKSMSSLTAESATPKGIEKRVERAPYVYVLVTPARNEAEFIEQTIKSVVAQTIRPAKWVIVSDGSTDGTDEIVRRYTLSHQWLELLRMPERVERDFAGKIHAFNAG